MNASESNMNKTIKGKEVLEALSAFREPVTLDKIVRCVAKTYSQPEEKVKKLVEDALNGGVRYGFVQKHKEFYYLVSDAVDALEDSSEEDEEDDVESAESFQSMDSGDITPEPKSKKHNKGSKQAPSRQFSKSKKVIKRDDRRSRKPKDICSDKEDEDEEDEEDDLASERRKRSHKCNSDCNGFHRRRSMDDQGHSRARSRSASRHR